MQRRQKAGERQMASDEVPGAAIDGAAAILAGAEGHLFLTGGYHDVRDYFTGIRTPTPQSVAAFAQNAAARQQLCARARVDYASIVFPEKLAALSALVDFPVRSLLRDVYAPATDASALPLYPIRQLAEPKYWKQTDTHLAHGGTLRVLELLLAERFAAEWPGFRAHLRDNIRVHGFSGDLGRKLTPPQREKTKSYDAPDTVGIESNGVKGANDGVMFIVRNPASVSDRRLLIFGDSFFRMILPQLAYFFRDIVFCRSRFFHAELVDAVAPDTVFVGCAERYLADCVGDDERPHFLAIPLLKGKASSPTPGFAAAFARNVDRARLLQGLAGGGAAPPVAVSAVR
jgi:hypothetical protein